MQKWDWKNGFIKEGRIDCRPGQRELKITGWRHQIEVKRFKISKCQPIFVVKWKTGEWKKVGKKEFFFADKIREYDFLSEEKALSKFFCLVLNKIN
jgi:hypothetical protein